MEAARGYLPLTLQPLCDLGDAMPSHLVTTQPLPREAEDFPRGGKYFNYVPLLT